MAMVLDAAVAGALAAPACRQLAAVSSSSPSSSPSSSSPCVMGMGGRCGAAALPVCRGLRVSSLPKKLSSRVAVRSLSANPSKGVVAEAQETVTGDVVNDDTWKSLVLDSKVPVLVDFWAPWCGPCRMIAPLIDDLAKQYAGKVRCLKLNTDESPAIASKYGIRSIPTVMIFTGGEKRDTVIGAVPKSTLTTTLEKYLT